MTDFDWTQSGGPAGEALPPCHVLRSHPATPAPDIEGFTVSLERQSDQRLWLRYHLDLPLDRLTLPMPAQPARADDLWRTTCCELFLRRPGAAAYAEFNFAASSQWAAYRFDDVRRGMTPLELPDVPEIGLDLSETHFALEAVLALPPEWRGQPLELAISAVIETGDNAYRDNAGGDVARTDTTKSYWALSHPADKPDFHHPASFTLEVAAP